MSAVASIRGRGPGPEILGTSSQWICREKWEYTGFWGSPLVSEGMEVGFLLRLWGFYPEGCWLDRPRPTSPGNYIVPLKLDMSSFLLHLLGFKTFDDQLVEWLMFCLPADIYIYMYMYLYIYMVSY